MPVRLIIEGQVQGVGFRYALRDEAIALGLQGWVRNRLDGTVEACIDGPEEDVDALVEWAWQGPSAATVTHVAVTSTDESELDGGPFRILPAY